MDIEKEIEKAKCNQVVFTQLDALLDTRLATVAMMDKYYAESLIKNGYRSRRSDKFNLLTPGFPQKEYEENYKNRNWQTIANAIPTNYIIYLAEYIVKPLSDRYVEKFNPHKPELIVNIHPYELTDSEKDVIAKSILSYMYPGVDVIIVDMPMEEITPFYLDDNIGYMGLYHGDDWLKIHSERLTKCKIPRVTLETPALWLGQPQETDAVEINGKKVDIFAFNELLYITHLDLIRCDVRLMSIIDVPKKQKTENSEGD